MSGYTPVFDTVFSGSLCGQYPDTAAWLFLLAMADKEGRVNMTPQYISSVTGMPLQDLLGCISRFMAPDPMSRTTDKEGRRLELLNPDVQWGWQIVNFATYRERARLMAKNAAEVASGRNRERMGERRTVAGAETPHASDDRRRPPDTAADPLSDADADSNTGKSRRARGRAERLPEDFGLTPERRAYAQGQGCNPDRTFADFCDHFRAASGEKARKLDWDAAWRLWCRREPDFKRGVPRGTSEPSGDLSALKARARAIGFRDINAGESVSAYRDHVTTAEQRRRGDVPQRLMPQAARA